MAAAGPQKVRKTHSLPPSLPLAAQQLHTKGDAIVPSYGQDAHEASQEGHLKHVLLVGIIVQVAREDLAVYGPLILYFTYKCRDKNRKMKLEIC